MLKELEVDKEQTTKKIKDLEEQTIQVNNVIEEIDRKEQCFKENIGHEVLKLDEKINEIQIKINSLMGADDINFRLLGNIYIH